jgi:hypothetical protein
MRTARAPERAIAGRRETAPDAVPRNTKLTRIVETVTDNNMASEATTRERRPGNYRRTAAAAPRASAQAGRIDLPKLFFVGPPRTATTWLHSVLKDRMSLPRLKETYFFDKFHARGFAWYLSHFDRDNGRIRAEIAPSYFFSEEARQRIQTAAGQVKIVVTLRDPVARLYSLYKMRYSNVAFGWSFEQACERDHELRMMGECAHHLDAWQRRFGKDRVLTLLYEDQSSDLQAWIDRVCRFAEIPTFRLTAAQMAPVHSSKPQVIPSYPAWTRLGVSAGNWILEHEWEPVIALVKKLRLRRFFLESGHPFPEVHPAVEEKLRRKLLPDVERLESRLGRDLGMWKPRQAQPS